MFTIISRNPFFICIAETKGFNRGINEVEKWSAEERGGQLAPEVKVSPADMSGAAAAHNVL